MSSIQQQYEQLTYPSFVHALIDPDRLAVIGSILGLVPPPVNPATASMLDLCCGSGTSLLAFAERYPAGRFVGMDFSAPDIAAANAVAAAAKMTNVHFEQGDLLHWPPSSGEPFDYITCYGSFSWVPDAVKDRMLAVIGQCLAPGGIAAVSYLTYPGARQEESLRDLLRFRTAGIDDPKEKVAAAHKTLDFFGRAWADVEKLPFANHLRDLAKRTREKLPHSLLLDDLGVERDPCYLLQFVSWAAEHGLAYLGDAEFHTMLPENLKPETARELFEMKLDRLQTEQMLDYIVNRSFRCTLLVRQGAATTTGMNADAFRAFAFSPKLERIDQPAPAAAVGQFKTRAGTAIALRGVPLVAFIGALADCPLAFTPYADLLEAAERSAGQAFTADERSQLGQNLLTLYGRSQVELSLRAAAAAPPKRALPIKPTLSPLNRAFASRRSLLVNARNQKFDLSHDQPFFASLLDGTRSLPALKSACKGKPIAEEAENFLCELNASGLLL